MCCSSSRQATGSPGCLQSRLNTVSSEATELKPVSGNFIQRASPVLCCLTREDFTLAYPELRLVPVLGKRLHRQRRVGFGLGLQPVKFGLVRILLGLEFRQCSQRVSRKRSGQTRRQPGNIRNRTSESEPYMGSSQLSAMVTACLVV